jgi:type IV pilus assembly protein PilO
MTNLQELIGQQEAIGSERLSARWYRLAPQAAGGLLGLVLLGAWVVPTLQRLNQADQRLTQKQAKAAQVPVLRQQLEQSRQEEQRVGVQRSKLLALIAGSGDLATFLAQVDREAQRFGVQLDVLEPAVPPPPPRGAAAKQQAKAEQGGAPPTDPLLKAGLASESLTLAAQGNYPSLLAFMRGVERLSLLVRQSDLALQIQERRRGTQESTLVQPPTELRFKVTLYSQKPASAAPQVAQASP